VVIVMQTPNCDQQPGAAIDRFAVYLIQPLHR
jgi:hypothetical protein